MGDRLSKERWEAVSPYLDRALELPETERDTWLATLQARDATLAREVEVLLQEHALLREESFLEGPVALPATQTSLAGQPIGAYTLRTQIGQGGMGSVWLAERSDGLFQGTAAVKLLNAGLVGRGGGGAVPA